MTIANLLKIHGHNLTRRVLPNGLLVFDTSTEVRQTASSMPLKSHTFHGGEAPQDSKDSPGWWLAEGALDVEIEAMRTHFPDFRLIGGDADSPPAWVGSVRTNNAEFKIAVMHRYSRGLPDVAPIDPKPRRRRVGRIHLPAPHLYLNGFLCVAAQEDWDPSADTAATVVGWAAHWHACYVEWVYTGKWPTESYVSHAA